MLKTAVDQGMLLMAAGGHVADARMRHSQAPSGSQKAASIEPWTHAFLAKAERPGFAFSLSAMLRLQQDVHAQCECMRGQLGPRAICSGPCACLTCARTQMGRQRVPG